jgi:hypothetical protein
MENLGFTHGDAVWFLGFAGVLVSVGTIVTAGAIDRLTTPWLSVAACAFALITRVMLSVWLTLTPVHPLLLVPPTLAMLLLLILLDTVVYQSVRLAIDRTLVRSLVYDNPQVGIRVWGLEYSLSNGAIALGLFTYDVCRTYAITRATANVVMQWLGVGASALCLALLVLTLHYRPDSPRHRTNFDITQPLPGCCDDCGQLITDRAFWRFVAFCTVLLGVASIFRHFDQTLPVVMQRLFTDKVHFALIQSINPVLIIVLAPLMQWLTDKRPSYWVIVGGSAVSVTSLLALALGSGRSRHAEATFLDYLPYIIFMVVFSIGEALWSARLTSYMLEVAPVEQKATYQALSAVPGLGARVLAAWHSGFLVRTYCPSSADCSPGLLWLIVWGFAALTPFCLTIGVRCVNPERRRQRASPLDPADLLRILT